MTTLSAPDSPKSPLRQRSFITVAIAVAVLLVGAVAVYAYDHSRDDVVANGVTAGGVKIGGLNKSKARAKLRTQLSAALGRPVTVGFGNRDFTLSARAAGVRLDTGKMVDDAIAASRGGNIVSRSVRELTGGDVNKDVPIDLSYDHAAVAKLVQRVKRGVNRAPQDANIDFSNGSLTKVRSHNGRQVDTAALTQRVDAKLGDPSSNRTVATPVSITKPKITTRNVVQRYPRVITINRSGFTLTLYKNLKKEKTYPIAVGMQGLETPAGRYDIQDKEVNPSWHVPNSSWAGSLAGQIIPPGPRDPIKARWMGIAGGAGIHGTDETGSIGTAGSHGCIRMLIPDVIDLFGRVQTGDPVFIS